MFFAKGRARKRALDDFIQNIYLGESLSDTESKKNLEESVVEIITNGVHSSNGLLVTDDGYFLTAEHCLGGKLTIRTYDGQEYKVEKRHVRSKKEDIALAKAVIKVEPRARAYKFYNTDNIPKYSQQLSSPVVLLTRWDGELKRKGGWMTGSSNIGEIDMLNGNKKTFPDQLTSHIESGSGDSGGTLVTTDGRLVGIHSNSGVEGFYSGQVKLFKALELIVFKMNSL